MRNVTSGEKDKVLRKIAVALSKKFSGWAKSLNSRYRFRSYSDVKHGLGLFIKGREVGWPAPYNDIKVIVEFRPSMTASAGTEFEGGKASSTLVLGTPYPPTEELAESLQRVYKAQKAGREPDEYDINFLKAFIMNVSREEFMVHELTHLVDNIRIGPRAQKIFRPYADKQSYINSPLEMNAFFQQAASKVDKHFEFVLDHGDAQDIKYEILREPLRGYTKFFLQNLHPGVWDNLTQANRHRFLKRIAGSYKELQAAARERMRKLQGGRS